MRYTLLLDMLLAIVVILGILWFLGYIHIGISLPDITLLTINGHAVTLVELLILLVAGWAISVLPNPFKTIAGVLLILWILSTLGILAVGGLSSILVLVIIIGIVASLIL